METLLPALLLALIVEIVLSASWAGFYFRVGLPIFRRRIALAGIPGEAEHWLAASHSGGVQPPLLFRRLTAGEIAFRERVLGVSLITYTPVMHGLIRYVPEERCAYVIGWANWFMLVFGAVTVWASREISDLRFPGIFAVIVLAIYAAQAVRYSSVARTLASGQLGP